VLERNILPILREPGEHLHEDFLVKILFHLAPGEVRAHDTNDGRVKMLDEFTAGAFIAFTHKAETGCFIESLA